MPEALLEAALARGALIVTPNRRLARELIAKHDRGQLAAGKTTWPAARVLPWPALVSELTASAQDAGLALPSRRLDASQEAALWYAIVARELAESPLLDADAAAELAAQAWERANGYGAGSESWRGFADDGPDPAAFARWAEAFVRETAKLDAIDGARAADALARVAAQLPAVRDLDLVLSGFLDRSPQQQRLVDALRAAGATVLDDDAMPGTLAPTARLAETATPRDELIASLDWARERALAKPSAEIGIVVLDLAERRVLVRALAEDRLCANLQWPGHEGAARPYDLSLGEPLAVVPLVATALDALALAHGTLPRNRAAVLARSPYLAGAAQAWVARATLERTWLEQGATELSLTAWIEALESIDQTHAVRWRHARNAWPLQPRATPRAWVERWRGWLDAIGWLEGRTLDSAEFQALGAWNELVAKFVRLAAVTPELSADAALAALVRAARAQTFQPEARGAQIRILGLLEAAGLRFDALWVAGFAADAWPQAPSPNPLLPIRWQRERGVPRSHPERELDYARRLTAVLSHAAPEVVFSYAARIDDHERAPSLLVASLERVAVPPERPPSTAAAQYAARPTLERIEDRRLPPLAAGSRLPGGSGMLDKQSACPFRAAACHRLGAREWPSPVGGLEPRERGALVHLALAAFWREVGDKATLDAMGEGALAQRIDTAAAEARRTLEPSRWHALPRVVAAIETHCLAALVRQWLVEVDSLRPDFSVDHTELKTRVELAGYALDIRIDRVDRLASGGHAIIDYKSGSKVPLPPRWFDARPQGTQLAVYAAGLAQHDPGATVRALVLGHVNAEQVKAIGIADVAATWPGLTEPKALKDAALSDWEAALAKLGDSVNGLAAASGGGEAAVTPRDRKVCDLCHLHALCRIGAQSDRAPLDEARDSHE